MLQIDFNYTKKGVCPSKIYWAPNPAKIIAITLEIILLFFINYFKIFKYYKNISKVKNKKLLKKALK